MAHTSSRRSCTLRDVPCGMHCFASTQALLANNHVADAGLLGVQTTLEALRANGIKAAGLESGGQESLGDDVGAFVTLEVKGVKVAIFSFCTLSSCARQTDTNKWGPSVLDNTAMKRIEDMRSKVDVLIGAVHWGAEYTTVVETERVEVARSLARLGVDVVVGHHAHVPQGHSRIGKTFAAFGLGNFVFDSHACRDPVTGELTNETMARSFACQHMEPSNRERIARLIRETRAWMPTWLDQHLHDL
jgi:poly-gamma-glutamate capsule biosynthesis protein CapA/YwtB (metallophosphatase superfamily)